MVVERGPGQFIGEVGLFEGRSLATGERAAWKTSVRAKGPVRALLLTRAHLAALLQQQPQAQAALRAGAHVTISARIPKHPRLPVPVA